LIRKEKGSSLSKLQRLLDNISLKKVHPIGSLLGFALLSEHSSYGQRDTG
jgi:hypothetical protein